MVASRAGRRWIQAAMNAAARLASRRSSRSSSAAQGGGGISSVVLSSSGGLPPPAWRCSLVRAVISALRIAALA
jgi:hypothetical protein